MKRISLQPAYILHRRPYRETSFLVELFSQDHGRISVIAKGVRKLRSSAQGILQPFIPLLVSFSGKGELMTLSHAEVHGKVQRLQGNCLFAGFYLNELLMCLLQKGDPHTQLYSVYEKTISALQTETLEQKILRSFEKFLLEDLGYGLLPKSDISLHNTILPDKYYRFVPDLGFAVSEMGDLSHAKSHLFSGKSLLAIAKEDWQDEECLQDAKRLTRFILAPLLGARPIYSRKLFMQLDGENKHEKEHDEK
jgi:DNA repair protein RecO (recombination protein O)